MVTSTWVLDVEKDKKSGIKKTRKKALETTGTFCEIWMTFGEP